MHQGFNFYLFKSFSNYPLNFIKLALDFQITTDQFNNFVPLREAFLTRFSLILSTIIKSDRSTQKYSRNERLTSITQHISFFYFVKLNTMVCALDFTEWIMLMILFKTLLKRQFLLHIKKILKYEIN